MRGWSVAIFMLFTIRLSAQDFMIEINRSILETKGWEQQIGFKKWIHKPSGLALVELKEESVLRMSPDVKDFLSDDKVNFKEQQEQNRVQRAFRHFVPSFSNRSSQSIQRRFSAKAFGVTKTKKSLERAPNDPEFFRSWSLRDSQVLLERSKKIGLAGFDLQAKKAWKVTTGSRSIKVAISDSGLLLDHPDFVDNLWVNEEEANGLPGKDDDFNGFVDDIRGVNFLAPTTEPWDDHGHGTQVASVIGAQGNNEQGISGLNWNIQLMPMKWLNSELTGSLSDAVASIYYAVDKEADIINCSWGLKSHGNRFLRRALDYAREHGVLIVTAAGNEGVDLESARVFPALYQMDHMISVAAIDNKGELWTSGRLGSNYGKKVDIAAPGEDIIVYGKNYELSPQSGTSLAAPHVTGVAALVLAHLGEVSPQEIKSRILNGARRYERLEGKVKAVGVLNAYRALLDTDQLESLLDSESLSSLYEGF